MNYLKAAKLYAISVIFLGTLQASRVSIQNLIEMITIFTNISPLLHVN